MENSCVTGLKWENQCSFINMNIKQCISFLPTRTSHFTKKTINRVYNFKLNIYIKMVSQYLKRIYI